MTPRDRLPWTLARHAGLVAFAATGKAQRSNRTDIAGGLVYWQTLAWLSRHGLVASTSGGLYLLTDAGHRELDELRREFQAMYRGLDA